MAWEFEMVAGPFNPRLTEGPAWDGQALLFTHIPASRMLRYDPQTGACTVFRGQSALRADSSTSALFSRTGSLRGGCIRAAFDHLPLVMDYPVGRVPDAPHPHLSLTMRTAQRVVLSQSCFFESLGVWKSLNSRDQNLGFCPK